MKLIIRWLILFPVFLIGAPVAMLTCWLCNDEPVEMWEIIRRDFKRKFFTLKG